MIKTNFYPLRTIVGPSIPIDKIIEYNIRGNVPDLKIETRNHLNIKDAVFDSIYKRFLPDIIIENDVYWPHEGMATMPLQNIFEITTQQDLRGLPTVETLSRVKYTDIPFEKNSTVGSIYGYKESDFSELNPNDINSGNDQSISFIITLTEEKLVGGICFQGYPFISNHIFGSDGTNLGNFGLPREIKLTPLSSTASSDTNPYFNRNQFIDSEFAYTKQEIVSHSGLNYLTIDPVKTNRFMLTFTDLPFIIMSLVVNPKINLDNTPQITSKGFKGFAIPYLYFFEYEETTKSISRLHSGLLGVKYAPQYKPLADEDTSKIDIVRQAFPEFECLINKNAKTYILYSAHSCLGPSRFFDLPATSFNYSDDFKNLNNGDINFVKKSCECFVSDLLKPSEKVSIVISQGEEFERCIAGIKCHFITAPDDKINVKKIEKILKERYAFGNSDGVLTDVERNFYEDLISISSQLSPDVNFCEKIGIKIYEIDPIDGVSPLSVDLKSKYATLLAETIIDDELDVIFSTVLKGIPFRKTSTSKYFAIEVTNLGVKRGNVVINSLELVRSAHVSVQPRPSKSQIVKTMHYRIIGADLANDFSKLGNEGFNFSIDRLMAGQTKSVLYSAMSLLDLLHTGGARIHSNSRRRAIEFEMVENHRENKDVNAIEKYEINKFAGDNFVGVNFEKRETDSDNLSWRSIESGKGVIWGEFDKGKPTSFTEFENYSGTETRSRTEQVSSLFPPRPANGDLTVLNPLIVWVNECLNALDIPGGPQLPLFRFRTAEAASNVIFNFRVGNTDQIWKPFEHFGLNPTSLPTLEGYQTLNITPFQSHPLESIKGVFDEIVANPSLFANPLNVQERFEFLKEHLTRQGIANGVNLGLALGPISISASAQFPTALKSSTTGAAGSIVLTGQELKHSTNRSKQEGYDNNTSRTESNESELKRIITRRELLDRDNERVRGAEVMWQNKIQDIITGSIPLNLAIPATATKMNFRTADEALRVRFNSGFSPSIEVDFWFELTEETIKDDN